MAWLRGSFNPFLAMLTFSGVLLLHASVNVLNDYFDYRSGIDLLTPSTPFSGGSKVLPEGRLPASSVLALGLIFLAAGGSIGTYVIYLLSFDVIPVMLLAVAAISVLTYSPFFSKVALGEFVVGMNFGPLLASGVYYVQTMRLSWEPIVVGGVLGSLTTGILYINQFPDTEADSQKGRRHIVARLGKARAVSGFKVILILAYLLLVSGVVLRITPLPALLGLLTIPRAKRALTTLRQNYDKVGPLVPGMADTVMTTLRTGILLLIAYLASAIIFYATGVSL